MLQLNFALDWLGFTDTINQYTMHVQDYSLMGYVPYTAVTFHLLFAANQPPRIQYPHSQYDVSIYNRPLLKQYYLLCTSSENLIGWLVYGV